MLPLPNSAEISFPPSKGWDWNYVNYVYSSKNLYNNI